MKLHWVNPYLPVVRYQKKHKKVLQPDTYIVWNVPTTVHRTARAGKFGMAMRGSGIQLCLYSAKVSN